jgi:hypothetical protein
MNTLPSIGGHRGGSHGSGLTARPATIGRELSRALTLLQGSAAVGGFPEFPLSTRGRWLVL